MDTNRYLVLIESSNSNYLRIYRKNPLMENPNIREQFHNISSIRFENILTPRQIIEEVYKKYSSPSIKGEFKRDYSGLIIKSENQTEKILKSLNKIIHRN